jgi:ankyrin repeat protein
MHGVDVKGQFKGGIPRKKVETVRLLIAHGVDVTAKDDHLSTPLHLASSSGIPEIVRLLIDSGADVTEKDGSSRTPLHLASSWVSAKAASLSLCLTCLTCMDRMSTTTGTLLWSPT